MIHACLQRLLLFILHLQIVEPFLAIAIAAALLLCLLTGVGAQDAALAGLVWELLEVG